MNATRLIISQHWFRWWRQTKRRYLNQCWHRSNTLYGTTRPQWVNVSFWTRYFLPFNVSPQETWRHDDVIKWKNFCVTGPLCREFASERWITLTKARDAELWRFLKSGPAEGWVKQSECRWFDWDAIVLSSLWRHCNDQNWTTYRFRNIRTDLSTRESKMWDHISHWGGVTHICVGKLTIIGSDNGLSLGRYQAITWTSVGILLNGPLGTNVSEILSGIQASLFNKMHLKMSSAKWRLFCLSLNQSSFFRRHIVHCTSLPVLSSRLLRILIISTRF